MCVFTRSQAVGVSAAEVRALEAVGQMVGDRIREPDKTAEAPPPLAPLLTALASKAAVALEPAIWARAVSLASSHGQLLFDAPSRAALHGVPVGFDAK